MKKLFLLYLAVVGNAAWADEINYEDHIKPIFREHCLRCHGDDKQKADLNLQNYASTMQGGSGGEAVTPGRSSQSLLFDSITDPDDDSRMPPNKPPIPQEHIDMIQKWIDTGSRESSSSKSMVEARDTSFQPAADAGQKPEYPAMPEELPVCETPELIRPLPVLSMDTSPWAPLLAFACQEHVKLVNSRTGDELGSLHFPEGIPHVLRFSRDGAVLLAAGGKPVEAGKVVLFDVKTGRRLAEVGDEVDAVLAADLSPDQSLVALGGTGGIAKVYSSADGSLKYKIEKHTDWVTTVAFSPDGKTLATGDRAGGIHLWDAASGRIRLSLSEHSAAVKALDWRSDSKFLASAGEDGRIVWWDTADGWPAINKTNAHPPKRVPGTYGTIPNGVLSLNYDAKGNLVSTGRDNKVRVWDSKGKQIKKFELEQGIPISAAFAFDGVKIFAGDSLGRTHHWDL
ncbi:MAG: hypothetical protein P1V20_13080 [Verrucomicrobiales bacterium]|nr:hypothetical protein [Verrucomicrobiales bacterium]